MCEEAVVARFKVLMMFNMQGPKFIKFEFLAHTWISLFYSVIGKDTDTDTAQSWREYKMYMAVEIRLLHLQPFTNIHFHFLIIVDLLTSEILHQ
jgi:hypothetical protein